MRKKLVVFLLIICSVLTVFSGYMVCSVICEYKDASDAYDDLIEFVELPEQTKSETEKSITEPEEPVAVLPAVDFNGLREKAPEVIAWLFLPDTAINYPVVQADDNNYYLRRLYDGTYNQAGCLFADYRCAADLSGCSTVIYGHNMRNGTMFSTLNEYAAQEYFESHPTMYLITPSEGYIVKIFAVFTASPKEINSGTSPWQVEWSDNSDFAAWLTHAAKRSIIMSNVTVNSDDRILTLSTCTDSGKKRFLVIGKLTAVNETE